MSLVPFLKWYPNDKCVLRGHGIEEDVRYICGDWPARYPVPTIYCSTLISNRCDERSNDVAEIGMVFDLASEFSF